MSPKKLMLLVHKNQLGMPVNPSLPLLTPAGKDYQGIIAIKNFLPSFKKYYFKLPWYFVQQIKHQRVLKWFKWPLSAMRMNCFKCCYGCCSVRPPPIGRWNWNFGGGFFVSYWNWPILHLTLKFSCAFPSQNRKIILFYFF